MLTQQIVVRCQDPSILQAMKAILQNVKILQGLRNIGTKHHNSSVRIAILREFIINIFMPWIGRHLALLMLWTIFSRCQDHSPQQNRLPCCISSCILQVPLLVYPVIFWNRPPKVAMAQPVLKKKCRATCHGEALKDSFTETKGCLNCAKAELISAVLQHGATFAMHV